MISTAFVSRVGLVLKCVDQGDVELIGCDKEFLFLLLEASYFICVKFFLAELLFSLLVAPSFITVNWGD